MCNKITYHKLVNGFRILRKVVPEHCGIISATEVGGWVPLLSVDEVREFGRVAHYSMSAILVVITIRYTGAKLTEENGSVIRDKVPVTLSCSKFDRKPTRITRFESEFDYS